MFRRAFFPARYFPQRVFLVFFQKGGERRVQNHKKYPLQNIYIFAYIQNADNTKAPECKNIENFNFEAMTQNNY
jgi:hypothetical protein